MVFTISWTASRRKMRRKNWYGRETPASRNFITKETPCAPEPLPGIPKPARMLIIPAYHRARNWLSTRVSAKAATGKCGVWIDGISGPSHIFDKKRVPRAGRSDLFTPRVAFLKQYHRKSLHFLQYANKRKKTVLNKGVLHGVQLRHRSLASVGLSC